MTMLYHLCHSLSSWADSQGIPLILARPKLSPDDFTGDDLDIIIPGTHVHAAFHHMQRLGTVLICRYDRADGVTGYFYSKEHDTYFHVDFITELSLKGIPYISVSEIINRSWQQNGITYADAVDQAVILVMTHGIKHQQGNKLLPYYPFLQQVIRQYPTAFLERLSHAIGDHAGADVYEAIMAQRPVICGYADAVMAGWKTFGIAVLGTLLRYHAREIQRRFSMPVYRIAFLGVDGAGKSTLIQELAKRLTKAFPHVVHTRFIPALPGQKEKDSTVAVANPHHAPNRSYFLSCLKLVYYYLRYWLVAYWPRRVPVLFLHDRYIADILVDPKRYRYAGPVLEKHLTLYPAPQAYVYLDITAETAWQRKQETNPQELIRQINGYKKLSHHLSHFYVINGEGSIDDSRRQAEKIILQVLTSP